MNVDSSLRSGVVNLDRDCCRIVGTGCAVDDEGDVGIDDRFDAVEQFAIGTREDAFEASGRISGIFCGPHHEPDLVLCDSHILR